MSKTRESFTTPVGRLVQGDCFAPQTKDNQGNLRVYKSGPNVGQPNPQFFVAVAFPKADPHGEFEAFYAILDRVARAEWPALFPTPGQPCVNPMFTMKVKDGDGVDRNGKSNATKEGFAGHWIVSFASAYAPKVVQETSPGVWATLTDPASVKRGYYVRVAGSCSGNDSPNTPGLYVNLDMVALVAYGAEIVSGPDAASAFGSAAALPAGASAVPVGGGALPASPGATPGAPPPPPAAATPPPPAAPAGPVMTALAAGQPYASFIAAGWTDAALIAGGYMAAPVAAATPPPAAPVAGYTGYMGVPGATPGAPPPPPAAATPPPPAAPAGPVMTALAAGQPYASFIAAGWTDAALIAGGYMAAPLA